MDMKNFWKVTKFTVAQQVKGKSFKISTAIILIAVLILTSLINFVPAFMNKDKANESTGQGNQSQMEFTIEKAYYIDESDLGLDIASTVTMALPGMKYEKASESRDDLIKKLDTTDEAMALVYISQNPGGYNVEVITPTNKDAVEEDDGYMLSQVVASSLENGRLLSAGLSQEQVTKLSLPINSHVVIAGDEGQGIEDMVIKMILPMVMCMLLFYLIYFYGYWVANSIVAEKTSRVMELLLTSTKPLELVVGKCVGMGFLAITQFISILVVAFISFVGSGAIVKSVIDPNANIFDLSAIFGKVPPIQWILIILFFILGYVVYAVLNALVGATVSKLEDLNTAIMPVSFISIIGFYLAYMGTMTPDSIVGTIATYVPFSCAFFIPSVILSGTISTVSMLISLLILIATIVLLVLFTSRVYSVVILQTGNRVKIKDLFSIYSREK